MPHALAGGGYVFVDAQPAAGLYARRDRRHGSKRQSVTERARDRSVAKTAHGRLPERHQSGVASNLHNLYRAAGDGARDAAAHAHTLHNTHAGDAHIDADAHADTDAHGGPARDTTAVIRSTFGNALKR